MNKKILFLASGNGGTFKFLYEAIKILNLPLEICSIIADRECGAIIKAQELNIENYVIKYSRDNNTELKNTLLKFQPDLIVTNIHKIIDSEILNSFENKFINLHYSLLPKYKGLIGMKTVDEAKKNNEEFIGGTCHVVNELVDAGEILCQKSFKVDWSKDITKIYDKVFRISNLAFLEGVLKKLQLDPTQEIDNRKFDESFWEGIK